MKNPVLLIAVLTALGLSFNATLQATSFNITGATTTAQTLNANETGVVSSTGTLITSSSVIPVTVAGNSMITNNGQIKQTGTGRGIVIASGTPTLTITNNAGALIQTADADALRITPTTTGGAALNNYGTITSLNASAGGSQVVDWSNITLGSNIVNNYSGGLLQASEADTIRPGVNGVVSNAGTIKSTTSTGSSSDGVDAQSNTGLTVNNAYISGAAATTGARLIEGARHGITGGALNSTVSFTTTVNNYSGGIIQGDNGSGINIDGFNANQTAIIVNGGTITGNGITGDGDGVDVDGVVNITNTGIIRSINAFSSTTPANSEGISVGGGSIINSGTIEGLIANGNTNAFGRGISLLGNDITSGPLAGTREAIYGSATVTNQSGGLIHGQNDSGIVVDGPASGFTVTINNNESATIRGGGTTTAAIQTGADDDTVNNGGAIDGSSSGKALSLSAGNDSLVITSGNATISGSIDGGSGNDTIRFNPGSGSHLRYSGSITNFESASVETGKTTLGGTVSMGDASNLLTVDAPATLGLGAASATDRLTVTLGGVLVNGTLAFRLDGASAGVANGYDQLLLEAANTGSVTLGGSSLLAITVGFAPSYGMKFNLVELQNSSTAVAGTFQGLAEGAQFTADGQDFTISYQGGTGNDVVLTAVPEPSTYALLGVSVGFLLWKRRRRSA